MNQKSISPIRTSRTPKPQSISDIVSRSHIISSKKQDLKTKQIQQIRLEIQSNKEYIKQQKEQNLKIARDKVQVIKGIKKPTHLKNSASNSNIKVQVLCKNNLKTHIAWINEVERKIRMMDEQENKLIDQINKACKIQLKVQRGERKCLTPRPSNSIF
ncbi:hypothetical protein SteCoe_9898 [Stentor coeruleus]|uniref:Uncharacterized protein n=1 Tax=Stentor coeruleus TaxID=5963 RepID=A0A1R2CGY7_9CILI|nr:hypothetical protein SteCoe_9898 [Stentor coeruleus]